jgi:predicted secreted protein
MNSFILGAIALTVWWAALVFATVFGMRSAHQAERKMQGKAFSAESLHYPAVMTAVLSVAGFVLAVMAGLAWV